MKVLLIAICYLTAMTAANAENKLYLMPGTFYFDYEETAEDGTFLDGESDPVPGLSALLKFQHESGVAAVLHGGIYSGTVDYDGHAGNPPVPAYSTTEANFFSLGAQALFPTQDGNLDLELQLGFQLKRWERNIQPTTAPTLGQVSGLYEVYEWEEFSIGMEAIVDKPELLQWRFYAGVFQTINPRISIDLRGDGDGEPKLYMRPDMGYKVSAQFLFKTKSSWESGLKLSYKTWRFGRSNSASISNGRSVTEPDSRTSIILFEFLLVTEI